MGFDGDTVVVQTKIEGVPVKRGKVRDVYDLGDEILLVATDRISAFDVVLGSAIPGKGEMLTRISRFWFEWLGGRVPHHLIEVVEDVAPAGLEGYIGQLRGRTMRCRKTEVVPIECVVRGYLAGSGWKDYERTGEVCGVVLPSGMRRCERLPKPVFTPSTKAEVGHDENIPFDEACEMVGGDVMRLLRDRSVDIYERASVYARERGIIIADTKFEWGRLGDEYILIDEVLTPDSSRFWPAETYDCGREQESFDKQYVRDYLADVVAEGAWDKTPPGPVLPDSIVRNTAAKYAEALRKLMG
jgi:phosphoribosylaminoimidazole-succinocarboxamide synthase